MWKLVKAEAQYNRSVMVTLLFILMLVFFSTAYLESRNINYDISISFLIAASLMYILFSHRFIEKRARFHGNLPVVVRSAAHTRLYSQVLYYLGAIALFIVCYTFYSPDRLFNVAIWRILSLSAVIIMANAVYSISYDLIADESVHGRIVSIIFLWILVLAVIFFYRESVDLRQTLRILYFTPMGVIVMHLVGIALSRISILIYVKRRTYLL